MALFGSLVLPKHTEHVWPFKYLHMDVYSSFIHNFQNLEVIKVYFSRWLYKQTVVHPDNEVYSVLKRNGVSQVALVVKNPPVNTRRQRDVGSIPGSGRPLEGERQPTSVFLRGESPGQRIMSSQVMKKHGGNLNAFY